MPCGRSALETRGNGSRRKDVAVKVNIFFVAFAVLVAAVAAASAIAGAWQIAAVP